MTRTEETIRTIFDLLEKSITMPYIGEKISQLEHALQCGDLALNAGADDELILGSFLHDIGHICVGETAPRMGEFGVEKHEDVGAEFLKSIGFSKRVCDLVRGHVNAKRYLAFKNAGYSKNLSSASTATLVFQGGPMGMDEALFFETSPYFRNILQLRAWDEAAKVEGKESSPLALYENKMREHLNKKSLTQVLS